MLAKLLSQMPGDHRGSEVISLTDTMALRARIQSLQVPVYSAGMRSRRPSPRALWRLVRRLHTSRPDLVHTWMYHADLIGGIAAVLAGGIPVVWSIRQSSLDRPHLGLSTWAVARSCAWLARWLPERIVSCSQRARLEHERFGYPAERIVVIPNGFDLDAFRPDAAARAELRRELRVPEEAPVIGFLARFHPQKDHRTFVEAAAYLAAKEPSARFLLCGEGVTWDNQELAAWIDRSGVRAAFSLLGCRGDVPRIMAALDLATSSSAFGEGFPNAIGEAMACGVPCVVTDVGDAGYLVGETGIVVPLEDPEALAHGWLRLLRLHSGTRRSLGMLARQRIEYEFNIQSVAKAYLHLYAQVVTEHAQSHRSRPNKSEFIL